MCLFVYYILFILCLSKGFKYNKSKFLVVHIIAKRCPECGSEKLEWTEDGLICRKCGLVLSETFYSGQRMLV